MVALWGKSLSGRPPLVISSDVPEECRGLVSVRLYSPRLHRNTEVSGYSLRWEALLRTLLVLLKKCVVVVVESLISITTEYISI
jgi:hypothetical protein